MRVLVEYFSFVLLKTPENIVQNLYWISKAERFVDGKKKKKTKKNTIYFDLILFYRALVPEPFGLLWTLRIQPFLGRLVHFVSISFSRNLIAEQLPLFTYVNIVAAIDKRKQNLIFFSSDSTYSIQPNQQTDSSMMHLTKDNPIIVTKVPYTPEEFLQKKIELLVDIYSETSRFLLCFFLFFFCK